MDPPNELFLSLLIEKTKNLKNPITIFEAKVNGYASIGLKENTPKGTSHY